MMNRLAALLCDAATRTLPAARKPWGEAMAAELCHAEDGRAALAFAGGCLLAALRERIRDFDSRFTAGLWSIALVTLPLAALHLAVAARGVRVLLGRPDRLHDALVASGAGPALISRYEHARPIVIACFVALGLAQFATAWLLARRAMRPFWIAWGIALAIAILAVAIQLSVIWRTDGLPSEFHALIVQALALPALLLWSNGRHRPREIIS